MADLTDKGQIIKYGGGVIKLREVTDAGVLTSVNVSGATGNGTTVTINTSSNHGLVNGDKVLITDISPDVGSVINGKVYTITKTDDDTFTIASGWKQTYSSGGVVTDANVDTLGYIAETTFNYDKPMEDVVDETGNLVASLPGMANVKFSGLLLQSGVLLLDFLRDNSEDKFYQMYYKMTPTDGMDGKTQELFAGIVKVKPLIEVKSGTRRPPFEFTFLENDSAITVLNPDQVYGSDATSAVIAASKFYKITET